MVIGSSTNSISALLRGSLEEVQESVGITQFQGEHNWVHIVGGLIFQGGIVSRTGETTISVNFNTAFPKQVLGVFINPAIFSITPSLDKFVVNSDGSDVQFYWFAIGI
jgi:hypothetical protein